MKINFKIAALILTSFSLLAFVKSKKNVDFENDNQEVNKEAIYIATNKTEMNSIVGFVQNKDGSLEVIGEFYSGGKGTGNIEIFDGGYDSTHPLADGVDPLVSAYGVLKTTDSKHLLVVNSGDGTVSSFKVNKDKRLTLASTVAAGDIHPLSIATHKKIVYVASSGNVKTPPFNGNVTGYTIDESGKLEPILNSTRSLEARPSCITFTTDGKFLVVSELVSGLVKIYKIDINGILSEKPVSTIQSPHDSKNGRWMPIPVGLDIVKKGDKEILLVSEARFLDNNGMLREEANKVPQSPKYSWQTGSTSSYVINKKGHIKLISGDVMTGSDKEGGQIANCWVEVSLDGTTLWASNALSSSISSYSIENDGNLILRNEKAFKLKDESLFFGDTYASRSGQYLYQLVGNKGAVMVFEVKENGNLKEIGLYTSSALPSIGAYGLIAL